MNKEQRKIEINAICKINRALALELKGNIFEQIVKETVQEAINYAHSCEQLNGKHKISFNDWLRVNCEPTRNKNLFIKNKKLQTRIELISMYEKEESL